MRKNPEIFLKHIQESIDEIENFIDDSSEEDFSKDIKTQDAVARRLEIIGEAVKNLPLSFKKKYPGVMWREIAGICDKLIHHYFSIDMSIVWETVNKDIPNLKKKINKILKDL